MKYKWRTTAAALCYILGVIGWCYVGVWMILTRPVKGLILAHIAGNLSLWKFMIAAAQGFVYLSLAGAVWCVGYILSSHFKQD